MRSFFMLNYFACFVMVINVKTSVSLYLRKPPQKDLSYYMVTLQ